eukprot:jgi/Tetstr1/458807/TSEL_045191.t1
MAGRLVTWSGVADRASAAFHALLIRSPCEYSTLETLVVSSALRVLATVCDLPLLANRSRQVVMEELRWSWGLWAAGTVLLLTRSATRRIQEQSRQAVVRCAALVDQQLTVTTDMEFSSAEHQAAFERWPGHGSLDVYPLVLLPVAHIAITGEMLMRQDVCTQATVLSTIPWGLAYVVRLVVWWRLSPAQRSWLNMALVLLVWTYLLAMVHSGNGCIGSFFKNLASSSLLGRMLAQMFVIVMASVTLAVRMRHMPWQAAQTCAGAVAFFHLTSPLSVEDPQLWSAAAYRQLAAMSLWAMGLWMLSVTGRAVFAEYTMRRFLASLRRD